MQGKFTSLKLILFLVSALFFSLHPLAANAAGDIFSAQQEIESLIESGQLASAKSQIEQLKVDYSQHPDLPSVLFDIAESYRWSTKCEEEKSIYQSIIQKYSSSSYSDRAKVAFSRAQIQSLILAQDYGKAEDVLSTLVADFSGHPDLPDALYWIAERYRWEHKWEKANDIYSQIIQNHPDSSYASRANLGVARAEVLSLLIAHDYSRANEALDKLTIDFKGHPDLPETLYWIAEGYRWGNRYEKAKLTHEQIVRNYPDSSYASRAKLGMARIVVLSSIDSRDYSKAQEALDKLVADFSGHPDMPDTLYWIAESYRWSDKYEITKEICKQIIQEYPQSLAADKARQQFQVTVQGIDVFTLIESGQEQKVKGAIDQLMANSSSNENDEISPYTVFLCGDRYYVKGLQKRSEGLKDEAMENFTKAINIWENMIQQLPASISVAHAYYHSANCYREMGEYERAIEQYVKLLENYPDYYLAWDAQFKIGHTYEKMVDAGLLSESEARPLIASAYQTVLDKYPHCKAAKAAQSWLSRN